jgi:SOS-response transcriptional repressor LexA
MYCVRQCLLYYFSAYGAVMANDARSIRLKQARVQAGYETATDAARALGVSIPTYTSHENGIRGFPASRAEQYARRFKVSLEWLLTGKGDPSHSRLIHQDADFVPLAGDVEAGAWREVLMDDQRQLEQLPAPAADLMPGARQYYLRVIGDSVNEAIPDGGLAFCCDVWDWARDSEDLFARANGKLVVCRRERSGLYETTIKRLRVSGGKAALHTASTSPRFKNDAPIELNGKGVHSAEIVAVVTGAQISL